jgi:hypothetical protein
MNELFQAQSHGIGGIKHSLRGNAAPVKNGSYISSFIHSRILKIGKSDVINTYSIGLYACILFQAYTMV